MDKIGDIDLNYKKSKYALESATKEMSKTQMRLNQYINEMEKRDKEISELNKTVDGVSDPGSLFPKVLTSTCLKEKSMPLKYFLILSDIAELQRLKVFSPLLW